jgi:hypothetical protein
MFSDSLDRSTYVPGPASNWAVDNGRPKEGKDH